MSDAYIIYDTANETYLAGGSAHALVWERTNNVFFAHLYRDEKTARMMVKRLNAHLHKRTWNEMINGYRPDAIPAHEPQLVVVWLCDPNVDILPD